MHKLLYYILITNNELKDYILIYYWHYEGIYYYIHYSTNGCPEIGPQLTFFQKAIPSY